MEKMISTSVVVNFLSKSFMSRHSLANLALSINGGPPFDDPNAQNSLNTVSVVLTEAAIAHVWGPAAVCVCTGGVTTPARGRGRTPGGVSRTACVYVKLKYYA